MLEAIIVRGSNQGQIVVTSFDHEARGDTGYRGFPKESVPDAMDFLEVSSGEASLDEIADLMERSGTKPTYIVPSFLDWRDLSKELKESYRRLSLMEITLEKVVEVVAAEMQVGMLIPTVLLTRESNALWRQEFFATHSLKAIIYHSTQDIFPFNTHLECASIFLTLHQKDTQVTRFFLEPSRKVIDPTQVIEDFQRCMRQGGGTTKYGFIHRDPIAYGKPITFEKYHPSYDERLADVGSFGEVRPLHELASLHVSSSMRLQEAKSSAEEENVIPLLTGRQVVSGSIDLTSGKLEYVGKNQGIELQQGDICLRSLLVHSTERLVVARVEKEDLPLQLGKMVILIRPNKDLPAEERETIYHYLGSEACFRTIMAEQKGIQLHRSQLNDLPIPAPDDDMRDALRTLAQAEKELETWRDEARHARDRIFEFKEVKQTRTAVLAEGRQIRQRVAAAKRLDDFSQRVQVLFPHPIAFRWRTVTTAHQDLEGYKHILECAEITIAYLAVLAILLGNTDKVTRLGYLKELGRQLSGNGLTFGSWLSILREVNEGKAYRTLPEGVPFFEVTEFLRDQQTLHVVEQLSTYRNKDSHRSGPKGHNAVSKAFKREFENLGKLLEAIEFISEYPLRYVESVHWDSYEQVSKISFRDVMGDHPLASLHEGTVEGVHLEASSLYVMDRSNYYHLARPLLVRTQCPTCGNWETFCADNFDPGEDVLHLKSFEHGHLIEERNTQTALKTLGLLVNSA